MPSFTPIEIFSILIFWAIAWHRWSRQCAIFIPELEDKQTPVTDENLPLVSIIVPARNEAHGIESCVRSLLDQDYTRLEVIAVDDRSEDGTGEILQRIVESDSRLKVIRGKPLAPGWMGKAHAIHQGYKEAKGDWLLFTDADTRHSPPLLSRVMSLVLPGPASLATVVGAQKPASFATWITGLAVFAYIFMVGDRKGFADPRSRQSLVNGQYLLISREAYEAMGTHEALREYSSTDVSLGYLIKLNGYLPLAIRAGEDLQTRMYPTFADAYRGWSRSLVNGIWTWRGPKTGSAFLILITIGLLFFWVVPWLTWLDGLEKKNAAQATVGFSQILAVLAVLWMKSGRFIVALRDLFVMPWSFMIFMSMVATGLCGAWFRKGTVWKCRVVRTGKRLPPWNPAPPRPRGKDRSLKH